MNKSAAIYCRISNDDKENDRPDDKGVTRQERQGRAYVKSRGHSLVGLYVDNDMGASRRSRTKSRPEWDRLMADVKAGRVQVIVGRDLDRLTRKMREIEDLIDLYEQTHVEFDLWQGHLDLSNAAGQSIARYLGAQAAGESDRTSERMKSQRRDAAFRGKPVRSEDGFGWRDGKHVAKEAAAIRDGAEMVIAGGTLQAVAREWNRRGLPRRKSSRPWWGPQVRVVLLNPRHAGLAVYRGEVVGETGEKPILDRATYDTMKAVLTNPSRRRAPRRRNFLTGLVVCSLCDSPMRRGVSGTPSRPMYVCRKDQGGCGRQSVMAVPVDEAVTDAVLDVLEASDFPKAKPQPRDSKAAQELAGIDQDLAELGTHFGNGQIPMAAFAAAAERLEARRKELLDQVQPTNFSAVLLSISPKTIRRDWKEMDPDNQRLIVAALIDRIAVKPLREIAVKRDPVARLAVTWKA
jgi:DNA invertase Pin-like site-specific DNA recombinase